MTEGTFLQRVTCRLFFSLLILYLILSIFFHRFRLWLRGIQTEPSGYFNRTFSFAERSLQKISNNCVIKSFVPSNLNTSGCPFHVEISCLSGGHCYVLVDVPTRPFHEILSGDVCTLQEYLSTMAIKRHSLQTGTQSFAINLPDHFENSHTNGSQRTHYSSVIALVSDANPTTEQVIISCYVIHVRLSEEEQFNTSILYTFWKTNWNRLLTPQVLYAARSDPTDQNVVPLAAPVTTSDSQEPHCFICLSSSLSDGLRVLLPCRHAGLCEECFHAYRQKVAWSRDALLHGILCCPLCRSPVYSVLCLPSHSSMVNINE